MARALWKGAIAFGLVNIPVELYAAEDRKSFKFSMLDKRDLSPVGYKRYSKATGKEVQWDDIVKGYEYREDEYVVLSDEDFRRANVKATQTIDIQSFVPMDEVPRAFFDTPYFLAPGGRSRKAYALLREALLASERIAIAQVVIRTRQHLAAVLADGKALMLNTLRYADEMVSESGLELPAQGMKSAGLSAKEVELAKRLVDDMAEHWNPKAYKDTYHDDLMARIKEKVKRGETKEITAPDKSTDHAKPSAKVIDLADLLKQSLAQGSRTKQPSARKAAVARLKPALRVVGGRSTAKSGTARKRA